MSLHVDDDRGAIKADADTHQDSPQVKHESVVDAKAVVDLLRALASSDLPASGRLVAVLQLCGVQDAEELATLAGVKDRMLRYLKAKIDTEHRQSIAATTTEHRQSIAAPATNCRQSIAKTAIHCRSRARIVTNKPNLLGEVSNNNKTPLPPKSASVLTKSACNRVACLEAFHAYNDLALRVGLQQASKLTADRERKLGARLRDYGMDGWQTALGNIERSDFLRGRNDRGWRASFDFLLQAESFAKVHDNAYSGKESQRSNGKASFGTVAPVRQFDPDDPAYQAELRQRIANGEFA